jgi:transcriptional regulator with XRE-family HTH domain
MPTLKDLRERAHLKQMEVAARVGTTPAKVSSWELGRGLPPTRYLAALAKTLAVSADDLLEAIDESRALAPPPGEDRRRVRRGALASSGHSPPETAKPSSESS